MLDWWTCLLPSENSDWTLVSIPFISSKVADILFQQNGPQLHYHFKSSHIFPWCHIPHQVGCPRWTCSMAVRVAWPHSPKYLFLGLRQGHSLCCSPSVTTLEGNEGQIRDAAMSVGGDMVEYAGGSHIFCMAIHRSNLASRCGDRSVHYHRKFSLPSSVVIRFTSW